MTAQLEDPQRKGALAALRSRRVKVVHVRAGHDLQPTEVIARVTSSRQGGQHYAVDLAGGSWSCTCPAGVAGRGCAHLAAVQLVTLDGPQ